MSCYNNGAKQVARFNTRPNKRRRVSSAEFETEFKQNKGFKGFDKVPKVLVARHDITPYLNKRGRTLRSRKSPTKQNIWTTQASIERKHPFVYNTDPLGLKTLQPTCTVNVLRENLEKLKESIIGSPRSDISASEVTMASIKCKICEKVYASERKLLNHQENKHMLIYKPEPKPRKKVSFSDHIIIHEVKEYHKCRKCTKIFEDYKLLKTHMKQEHKKRKCYICNYCNKNFVDRMFFKVHIKLHCDLCGLLLPNKSSMFDHRRNICRTVKLHKCKTCELIFFRFMDLKDHSYNHLSVLYVCDVCKDQFSNKCELAHHISFLHSKNRPTTLYSMRNLGSERLYLCNFCDESSVDRDIIEAHVQNLPDLTNRAMTGYKDFYFCDQCLKKFGTEQDMLQHKWTHFLKTSDNSQTRPKSILSKRKLSNVKTTYNVKEEIPEHFRPSLVLSRIDKDVNWRMNGMNNFESIKKSPRKTLISKHQCPNCGKYYSSNYCLNRHIETQHSDYERLRCKVCEETFVWPSLLQSHKCIRLNLPEMPFEDARPEIHFDNLHEITQNSFDDFNIEDNDDYMNTVDFEIPAPIVELTEGTQVYNSEMNCMSPLQNIGYKVVMQEVPIEF